MGVYYYAVRQKTLNASMRGSPVKVCALTYLGRVPMHYLDYGCNDGKIRRVKQLWEDLDVTSVKGFLVSECEHWTEGATVLSYKFDSPVCTDGEGNFGEVVGTLHREGRRWVIVPR